jgi:phthiocerol/phenolphthiocerol synthesis type-I polyketide synthase E
MNKSSTADLRNGSEIAVIGLSGRFPGAKNVDEYWRNLRDGVESISFFTDKELESCGIDPTLLRDPHYVKAKGILEDADLFDASFFGFTPREAEIMDPQHRLFLECAWEALESAGYDPEGFGGLIGVYGGAGQNNYFLNNLYPNRALMESVGDFQAMLGNEKDFMATRVSYKMNLRGPSVVVQTGCSTSLVAVCQACQSLLSGDCDIALAGASSINVPQKGGYRHQNGGITSLDGHCRAFDAQAQGTVFSNAVGFVVLKRLEEALADGDCIHAVIKGAAINNDGSFKVGYTAPSVEGQAKVIRAAQIMAEVQPETVTYIETHGTATALGDPIEMAALTQAFRAGTQKKGFCAIGSVKTNIGHTDAAAGIAGLIKTVLMLKNRMMPPSLHFEKPNPEIDFANSPFYVNAKLSDWKTDILPRRAGVSAFGIGGTNAHVILEEAPDIEAADKSRPWKLLLLSAKTNTALDNATTNLVEYLKRHPQVNLADVASTLQIGRKAFSHRRIAVCRDIPDAVTVLGTLNTERVMTSSQASIHRDIVFMFSGQGSQYVNMGLDLYKSEATFRDQIDRCSEILLPHLSFDLRDILYPGEKNLEQATQTLTQTFVTQPALFTIEYALAKLWMSWGVTPTALVGHSIGEYVAACLAGVFSLKDALTLVAERGRLMQQLPEGSMLVVPLSEKEIQSVLGNKLSLAVINGPSLCVVSGEKEAVEDLKGQLSKRNISCRHLHTSHAFHSEMMEPILAAFIDKVKDAGPKPPQIPFVSNVTGTWISPDEAASPSYWARHLRHTVRFSDCLHELLKDPNRIFLEVGPGYTFSVLIKQHPSRMKEHIVLSSIRHSKDTRSDSAFILSTLGQFWLAGTQIDWPGFYADEDRQRLPLPTYPFERKRYWISAGKQATAANFTTLTLPDESDKVPSPDVKPLDRVKENPCEDSSQDERERIIVKIWQELLGIDRVNIHDNFFELGGNSLTALRMISQVETVFGKTLPLSAFKAPTVKQLVDFLVKEGALS